MCKYFSIYVVLHKNISCGNLWEFLKLLIILGVVNNEKSKINLENNCI